MKLMLLIYQLHVPVPELVFTFLPVHRYGTVTVTVTVSTGNSVP
jgi:hypothetical protein